MIRFGLRGVILVAFSVIAFYDGHRLSNVMAKKINIDAIGPHGYLILLGLTLLALGIIMIVQNARVVSTRNAELSPDAQPVPWLNLGIVTGLLVLYAWGITTIGFTLATFAFLLLVCRRLTSRTWIWCAGFSGATTAGLYVAFIQLSDMALPRGLF